MSNVARVAGQAANTLVKPLNVEEVFSTYLYDGTNATQTITNGIDLAGEGGLVWCKSRNQTYNHGLVDTERGVNREIKSNDTGGDNLRTGNFSTVSAFNSNGFSLGPDAGSDAFNKSSTTYCSWTFRKAPKFFDVVTYTGTGVSRTISHNLGSVPGVILIKGLDSISDWAVYHRSYGSGGPAGILNGTNAAYSSSTYWNNTDPTSTQFTLGSFANVNTNGETYVAYLFAHNDGDGEFGPNGNDDIIKCGSYTGTAADNNFINIGFEPQWLLTKRTNSTGAWNLVDNMRAFTSRPPSGAGVGGYSLRLSANTNAAESTYWQQHVDASGFILDSANGDSNASGGTYIYMAIRRPTAVPESATEVFDANQTTSNQFVTTGFPVDLQLGQYTGGGSTYVVDRMRGMSTSTTGSMRYLTTQTTNAEANNTGSLGFNGFVQNGFSHTLGNYEQALWSWKRAPKYFDVVAYTGNSTAGRTVSHNLNVAPEMMWVKRRNSATDWRVYHKDIGNTHNLKLNDTAAKEDALYWNDTTPTNTVFTLNNFGDVNGSGNPYIAYLFASLAGISKVGSYIGTGNNIDVDCGFTSGARFVLIKPADDSGSWYLSDSVRGINAGNDPTLKLEDTGAQFDNKDWIDPLPAGFTITSTAGTSYNASGITYIFYAIA